MSGHSKWSTIKRQKGVNDAKRGQLFSKLTRAITLAAREGGSSPEGNIRLRLAIEQARASNMPKENIERAVKHAAGADSVALQEVLYEGYGPFGIAVIVEVATDNKNRTGQEIKNIFEKGGGSLGGPGSVSFQFEQKGLVTVEKGSPQETMLSLIDMGAQDLEEGTDVIEVYVTPNELSRMKEKIEQGGIKVMSAELTYKPKNVIPLSDKNKAVKALSFLDILDDHDDVQRVFANFDIPDNLLSL
ncbi:MAG: YebC/PmpR family DNA-binding transcriptional regulator [bacterium]|nr:YebC/PmpR family DNA-binding transcriptional regulator [bacterium]